MELKNVNVGRAEGFEYNGTVKHKENPIYINGRKTYPRDKQTSINALVHANYECEIDCSHPTFIRRNSGKKYTEPHHLVPMAYSGMFEVSLDREQNIVSLCSNCHNQIHYGIDSDKSSISLTYILSLESICTLVVERLSSNSCVHLFH